MRLLETIMFSGAIVAAAVVSGSSRTPSSPSVVSGFPRPLHSSEARRSAERGGGSWTQQAEVQRFPQFDNDRARSWRSVIRPHSQSTLHRHDYFRALIALTGGELKTVTSDGQTN